MITVLCGIIYNTSGEVFLARRREGKSHAGKWEFPGGKLEAGESEAACLQRELLEELGMEVKVQERLGENVHAYSEVQIRLIAYRCKFIQATFVLTDHDEYAWVKPEKIAKYDLAEADVPFLQFL